MGHDHGGGPENSSFHRKKWKSVAAKSKSKGLGATSSLQCSESKGRRLQRVSLFGSLSAVCWHIDVDGKWWKMVQSRQESTPHVISLAHPKLKKQTQTASWIFRGRQFVWWKPSVGAIAVAIDRTASASHRESSRTKGYLKSPT